MKNEHRTSYSSIKFARNQIPRVLNLLLAYDNEKNAYYACKKRTYNIKRELNYFLDYFQLSNYIEFEFDKSNQRYYLRSNIECCDDTYAYSVWHSVKKYFNYVARDSKGSSRDFCKQKKVMDSVKNIAIYVMTTTEKLIEYSHASVSLVSVRKSF